jgi:hypothetical protein
MNKLINICLGKALLEFNNIINSYICIKLIVDKNITKLNSITNDLLLLLPTDPIPDEISDKYFNIVNDMRHRIENILNKKLIPNEDKTIMYHCGKCDNTSNSIEFSVSMFAAMHFLQETNCNNKYLYFLNDPSTQTYELNQKVTIEHIPDNSMLYPVWYYIYNNTLSQNYTYMMNLTGSTTFNELSDYRTLLKDKICMRLRKSTEAFGKYKFTYDKDGFGPIILPDPNNPSEFLSPKDQGIIDGVYSFAESIDTYTTVEPGLIAVTNTLIVLNKLSEILGQFIEESGGVKQELCCSC